MKMQLLTDVLTDDDGVTFGIIKVLALAVIVVAIGLAVAGFVLQRPFDVQNFGIGMAAVFVAVGGALKLTAPVANTATNTTTNTTTVVTPP